MRTMLTVGLVSLLLVAANASTNSASKNDDSPQGTWTLIRGEADGKPLSDAELKGGKLVIEGDHYTVTLAGKGTVTGTEKLDPAQNPKTIDITNDNGADQGKTCLGIYELKDGEFQVAFAPPGKPRPTSFATTPDSGQWMHVWRQVTE